MFTRFNFGSFFVSVFFLSGLNVYFLEVNLCVHLIFERVFRRGKDAKVEKEICTTKEER